MRKLSREENIINGRISAEKKYYNCGVSVHSHDFFEFEYVISGEGSYCIDGVDYKVRDKTLYFMTPVNFHSVDMNNTVFYNVMFSADMCDISILSKLFSNTATVIRVDDINHVFICSLLDELCKNCENIEYASLVLETLIFKINNICGNEYKREISEDIRSGELYILENFKSKLTLPQVASYVHLSESHFSRKFAQRIGKSFKEYLNNVRFDYAKKLLVFSNMTVSQVCFECGFDDYPNFIRRFRQKNGVSPTEYRKLSLQYRK